MMKARETTALLREIFARSCCPVPEESWHISHLSGGDLARSRCDGSLLLSSLPGLALIVAWPSSELVSDLHHGRQAK